MAVVERFYSSEIMVIVERFYSSAQVLPILFYTLFMVRYTAASIRCCTSWLPCYFLSWKCLPLDYTR